MNVIKERIKRHEGYRAKPYYCSGGKLTIGYGRNIEELGISKAEAEFLLESDIKRCHQECLKSFWWYGQMDPMRQGVLVELCFNLGVSKLKKFKKMLLSCELKNYALAADEMLSSLWARQVGGRAQKLAEIMRKGA